MAAQGRAGRRFLLCYNSRRSAHSHNPAADRRSLRPPGADGEGVLKQGASVNLQNSLGINALTEAARYGHLSIMYVLLQHSASPVEGPPAGRARAASRPCPGQVCWPAVQLRGPASRS